MHIVKIDLVNGWLIQFSSYFFLDLARAVFDLSDTAHFNGKHCAVIF